jgi:hypothetical protein
MMISVAGFLPPPSFSLAAVLGEDSIIYISKDKRMGTLRKGAQVEITEDAGEWVRVTYETMDATFEGYVKKTVVVPDGETIPSAGHTQAAPPPAEGDPAALPARGRERELVEPEPSADPQREPALSSYWQNGARNMSQSTADFIGLLNDFGSGQAKSPPDQNYVLYRKMPYLAPVADLLKTMGNGKVVVEALKAPGLPADSFIGHSVEGFFDGFSRITLVADRKGQLVAVQLSDRSDKEPWLRDKWWNGYSKRVEYSDRWRLINLLEGRMKGSSAWQMGYGLVLTDGVLRIDSEMVSGPDWQSRSKERHRTYLPQPVVDLLLQMVAKR